MPFDLCEQYIQYLSLTASDFLLAGALMHCDNKTLQNWFNPQKP